jgi:hypothetical protein
MISDNLLWDSKPGYNLVEYEECCRLTIGFNSRHGLCPFSEVIHGHNNMLMPTSQSWATVHKIYPPLGEWINGDDWVKRGWMRVHFLRKHLARVTLLDRFNIIFKN